MGVVIEINLQDNFCRGWWQGGGAGLYSLYFRQKKIEVGNGR